MGVRLRLRAPGKPRSLGDPFMIQLSRLGDGKKSLRHARPESLVHDSEIKRHRNRIGLVRVGVVELAVHHDGNRNDVGLAFIGNLNQPKRARTLVCVLALVVLYQFLRMGFGGWPKADQSNRRPESGSADDGAEPHTI